jgi:cysteine synthase A
MLNPLQSIMRPTILEPTPGLMMCQFDIMKLIPAYDLVRKAMENGELRPNGLVVESSSGTFGLALAIVCKHFQVNLSLVTGPLSPSVRWRLENLDVDITIIETPSGAEGGIQADRKKALLKLLESNQGSFWPRQHTNPDNPLSYQRKVSNYIFEKTGPVDILICSVGTGGSISGLGEALRERNNASKIVAVDHNLSILFGPTTGKVTNLCTDSYNAILGMGADVVAANLQHDLVDEVHWVPMAEMVRTVHQVHRDHGVLIGPTGGATFLVASYFKAIEPDARILCVTPDHGFRYADTIFNDSWLSQYTRDLKCFSEKPQSVLNPRDVTSHWAHMNWGRRSYSDVLGHEPMPRGASSE